MTSPIERLIDQACGCKPTDSPKNPEDVACIGAGAVSEDAAAVLLSIADSAKKWWESRRPKEWSVDKHLENPVVNIEESEDSRTLARAVASWVKLGG